MTDSRTRTLLLFVCTANECRSPFAAAIARRDIGDRPIDVDSAGLDSWRRRVPETGLLHAERLGLDLSAHVSSPVHVDALADYDLILGLAREHTRELAALDPLIRPRLFTVKQFARWIGEHPRPRRAMVGPWLDARESQRSPADFLGAAPADDIADPVGKPIEYWQTMTDELEPAIAAIVQGLDYGRSAD